MEKARQFPRRLRAFFRDPVKRLRKSAEKMFESGARRSEDWWRSVSDFKERVEAELRPAPLPVRGSQFSAPAGSRENIQLIPIRHGISAEGGSRFRRILVVGGMEFFGAMLVRQLNARGIRDISISDGLERECWRHLSALSFGEFLSPAELSRSLSDRAASLGEYSHIFYLGGWEGTEAPLALPKALLARALEGGGRLITLSSAASLGSDAAARDRAAGQPEKFRPETREGVMACLFDRHAMEKAPPRAFLSLKHYRLFGPNERPGGGIHGLVRFVYDQIPDPARLPEALRPESPAGKRRFDFLSVRDAVRMAIFLAEREAAGGIYELGSGVGSTAWELVETVFAAAGRQPDIKWETAPFLFPPSEPEAADLGRLRGEGWREEGPALAEAVGDYVRTYLIDGKNLGDEEFAAARKKPRAEPGPSSAPTRIFPSRKKPFQPRVVT